MQKLFFPLFLIFCLTVLSACATIISGGYQQIPVVTNVPGAAVYINNEFKDSTPFELRLKRGWDEPPVMRVEKPGYVGQDIDIKLKMNEIVILNFINIFGWITDGASGSCIRYQIPDTIQLTPKTKRN